MEERIIKKQLVVDLDINEAPTGWRWKADRIVTFDDGTSKVVADEIGATAEEASAMLGVALAKQAADIEADRIERNAIRTERDAAASKRDALTASLQEAQALIAAALRE